MIIVVLFIINVIVIIYSLFLSLTRGYFKFSKYSNLNFNYSKADKDEVMKKYQKELLGRS